MPQSKRTPLNRRTFLKSTGAAGVASTSLLAGCLSGDGDGGDDGNGGEDQTRITWQAAAEGTTYFALSAPFGEVLREHSRLNPTVTTTGGGVENVRVVGQMEAEFGIAVASSIYQGTRAIEPFQQEWDVTAVALIDWYPNIVSVRQDSDIESIEDLDGRPGSPGPAGSGANADFKQAMDKLGIEPIYRELEHGQGAEALQDREIDWWYIFLGPHVREAYATYNPRPVGFTQEQLEIILEDRPWDQPIALDSSWLEQIEGTHWYFGNQPIFFTHRDQEYDLVREVVEVLFEHGVDALRDARSNPEELTPEFASYEFGVDYHEAARDYYDEAL